MAPEPSGLRCYDQVMRPARLKMSGADVAVIPTAPRSTDYPAGGGSSVAMRVSRSHRSYCSRDQPQASRSI